MVFKVLSGSTVGAALIFVILSLLLVLRWPQLGAADPKPELLGRLLERARSVADLEPAADDIEKDAQALKGIQDSAKHVEHRHMLLEKVSNLAIKADVHVRYLSERLRDVEAGPADAARDQEAERVRTDLRHGTDVLEDIRATARTINATPLRNILVGVDYALLGLSIIMAASLLVLAAFSSNA